MNHIKEVLAIKVADLVPSQFNVRRYGVNQVEELAALIDSQGLLQPLIVTEQVDGKGRARKLRFAVAAGERRRRALLLLQQRGRLPKAHEVLCELVAPERAREVSLAENSGREPMHPADEFEAFSALIAEGKGVEDVAARFGVSVLTVQRRLKLAAVSPKLLALYREDGINLDVLMAVTLTDDHATQERAWFEAKPWDRNAAAIRRVLTAGEVLAHGDALVRFVGLEAYEAAGGIVRRDLFDSEQSRYLNDAALLRRLAEEKLEGFAELARAEGWSWAEARIDFDSHALRQFARREPGLREPTADEQTALAELTAREAELDAEGQAMADGDSWTDDEAERIDLEEQDIAARRTAIVEGRRTWTLHDMAHAGVIVTISRQGEPEVLRGLVREADRKAIEAAARRTVGVQSAVRPSVDDGAVEALPEPAPAVCSEALMRRLTAHKTAALQAMLAQSTPVALAALTHGLLLQVFDRRGRGDHSPLQVIARPPKHDLLRVAEDVAASRAWKVLAAVEADWLVRLPEQSTQWLAWLCALPLPELLDLLAFCAAVTVNTVRGKANEGDGGANALAAAAGLDMADWWEPTADGYLAHVSKVQIVKALREAGPDPVEVGVADLKKDVLVVKAVSQLSGKRWLPEPLRAQAPA